ncbi:MAG: hypothetical protein IKJ18_09260 [Bacteroidaceae bacterium]|nr:hypothetical protein [Bacteroidaceae bacterium]
MTELEDLLQQRLLDRPSKALTMVVAAEAMVDGAVLDALFRLVYGGEDPLRWRVAWVLEKVSGERPSLVEGERCALMQLAMQTDIPDGMCRLLLGILHNLPDVNTLDVPFFNFLLDRMCDLQSPPGVQSLAMKLACRMSRVDPELYREFLCILRNMELDYYSAGVRAVVRHCLKNGK